MPNLKYLCSEEGEDIQTNGTEKLFSKIMTENFQNPGDKMDMHLQEAFKTLVGQDQKGTTPQHITTKMLKIQNKERISNAARKAPTHL